MGFKGVESKGVELSAAQNVRRTFVMEVGAITKVVSVAGTAALFNPVSSEQRNTFDQSKFRDLPVFRRNYTRRFFGAKFGTGVLYRISEKPATKRPSTSA